MLTKEEIGRIRVGSYLHDDSGDFRIMAIAEGYALMRRVGCIPFAAKLTDFADPHCFHGHGPLRFGRGHFQGPNNIVRVNWVARE